LQNNGRQRDLIAEFGMGNVKDGAEDRGQRAENRRQKTDDGRQRTDISLVAGQENGWSDRKRNFALG